MQCERVCHFETLTYGNNTDCLWEVHMICLRYAVVEFNKCCCHYFGYICRLTLPRIQAWEPIICHPTPHCRDMLRQTEMYIYQGTYCNVLNWEFLSKTCFSSPMSKTQNLSQICYHENSFAANIQTVRKSVHVHLSIEHNA